MTPILYTFRRCPYAMRARMGLAHAGIKVELREIILRNKPAAMLKASPKGTVPVLVTGQGVIDESFDILRWALAQSDPQSLLDMPPAGYALIERIDGPFKSALDRTKYHTRLNSDADEERTKANACLATLSPNPYLLGSDATLADIASFPFVRQFANIDRARFDQDNPHLTGWLDHWLNDPTFQAIMEKFPLWDPSMPALHLFLGQNTPIGSDPKLDS